MKASFYADDNKWVLSKDGKSFQEVTAEDIPADLIKQFAALHKIDSSDEGKLLDWFTKAFQSEEFGRFLLTSPIPKGLVSEEAVSRSSLVTEAATGASTELLEAMKEAADDAERKAAALRMKVEAVKNAREIEEPEPIDANVALVKVVASLDKEGIGKAPYLQSLVLGDKEVWKNLFARLEGEGIDKASAVISSVRLRDAASILLVREIV